MFWCCYLGLKLPEIFSVFALTLIVNVSNVSMARYFFFKGGQIYH